MKVTRFRSSVQLNHDGARVSSRYSPGMNLTSFLRRLRHEAMPPVPEDGDDTEGSPQVASEAVSSGERPSIPWRLSQQDISFLKRRLRIDPEI